MYERNDMKMETGTGTLRFRGSARFIALFAITVLAMLGALTACSPAQDAATQDETGEVYEVVTFDGETGADTASLASESAPCAEFAGDLELDERNETIGSLRVSRDCKAQHVYYKDGKKLVRQIKDFALVTEDGGIAGKGSYAGTIFTIQPDKDGNQRYFSTQAIVYPPGVKLSEANGSVHFEKEEYEAEGHSLERSVITVTNAYESDDVQHFSFAVIDLDELKGEGAKG
jgi:hypothetical protein